MRVAPQHGAGEPHAGRVCQERDPLAHLACALELPGGLVALGFANNVLDTAAGGLGDVGAPIAPAAPVTIATGLGVRAPLVSPPAIGRPPCSMGRWYG
jgi:hypothetical protein